MFSSLRIRLTLLFVSLTIVPLLIVGTLISLRGFDTLQQQSVEKQAQLARQTAISLGAFFSERQNELQVLAQVYGLDALEPRAQRDVLLTLLSAQPAYYELTLVNGDGQETIRLTRGEVITTNDLANRADDPLFRAAADSGQVSFSPVYFNQDARDRLITIAVPMEDLYTGETGYVLIAEVRFQNVEEEVLRNLGLGEGEDVYVVDQNGVVIAHRNPNLVLRETIFNPPEVAGRHIGLSGSDVVLATDKIRLENLELTVVAETTYANATALASDLTRLSAIITIVTLVVSGIIVIWAVRRVVKPIIEVARVAKAIQEGDLSAKANEDGQDEIATLGRAFNRMTAHLQETLDGLRDHVEKLERSRVEREMLIRDLQAAKRIAEENSRLKSEFLSTMSHELRTPMNAIEGFTGIMLRRMAGVEYNAKAERYLTKIQSNSQRLLSLINDFLDLSRIESGRLELAYLPMSLPEMVQRWQDNLGVLAENKGLTFEVTLDPELLQTIYGDEESLSKIVTNLVGNAIKFTEHGSVTLSIKKRGDQMELAVQDTGIGIPPHAREFIFEEFRQVDQSSKRQYGGTGLGLAIVQKLVRAMGGTVTVDSEVGVGSTFTVLLPIHLEEQLVKA